MSIDWVRRTEPELHELLETFRGALPHYLPESQSAMLFGGITLGGFSHCWSDVDLIVWVSAGEVTQEVEERAVRLWRHLAEKPLGDLIYLYVAPVSLLSGPMNIAGGGTPGQPGSLCVYRQKSRLAGGPGLAGQAKPAGLPAALHWVREQLQAW